jgi:mannose-1-phosphate guanylyltransferase/mannose-6-phosphate isomerase
VKIVILAGGGGTRLWPLSRDRYPKQFLKLFGEKSLLRITYERALNLVDHKDIIIVSNKDYQFHIRNDLFPYEGYSLILEPEKKNTASAIAVSLCYIREKFGKEDETILVMASDHYIEPLVKFLDYINFAKSLAEKGYMVVFGIKPTRVDVNFGYIKIGNLIASEADKRGYLIDKFIEKPPYHVAESFVREGTYFWNSGNFIFRLDVGFEEYEKNAPEVYEFMRKGYEIAIESYSYLPDIAFDYIEMEKTKRGAVVPMDITWSDLGSFEGIYSLFEKDNRGNACRGDVICIDTRNSLAYSSSRLVCLLGVGDIVVVEEKDAILVTKIKNSSKVKDLVNTLKSKGREEAFYHTEIDETWGKRYLLESTKNYKIYRLVVYPNKEISKRMHMHQNRSWSMLKGTVCVELDGKVFYLSQGDTKYANRATPYSIKNCGLIPAEILEIITGEYLGDDDILPL